MTIRSRKHAKAPSTRQRLSPKPAATFDIEERFRHAGANTIAGVDEAGRGPWAGPVVAAAVILDAANCPTGLADSKTLDEPSRERLYGEISACARVGIGIADVARIDRDNILAATLWAMAEAVARLPTPPCLALIDGNRAPKLACRTETIVKGDALSLSIAAASIIAKVTRDRLMRDLDATYPGYGFASHKGYGTPQHRQALAAFGVTAHHRRSFRPVQLALARDD